MLIPHIKIKNWKTLDIKFKRLKEWVQGSFPKYLKLKAKQAMVLKNYKDDIASNREPNAEELQAVSDQIMAEANFENCQQYTEPYLLINIEDFERVLELGVMHSDDLVEFHKLRQIEWFFEVKRMGEG